MCGLLKSPSQEYSTSTRSVAKKSDCWYTPLHIVQLVLEVLGEIDLDPCADDGRHIPAALHYTTTLNGLLQKWLGRVFMNPPYSCPGVWINKLQSEVESGRVREAIALVPAATDTNWLSPVLKVQPVCFWKGRIKFLDVNYQPKLPARQSHCLVYWGENWQKFKEVFEEYGVVQLPPNLTSFELLGDIKNSPSKKRGHGFGNGYIHWRTITKNGKDYPQAYYHWKENGNKRSKYIPKKLLGVIQEAEAAKRPVIEILGLLGVVVSPSKLLGEIKVNPSNLEVLGDIENSPSNHISPSNNSGDIENSPSKVDLSPSKTRRHKGEGSGSIYWRTITKSGKDYPQAYYHYEFWNQGDRLIKSTKYIPKQLLAQVQQLDATKAPVREILEVLGIIE
ncbi:hypothetical protein BV378_20405 [Nostoc sp. RF31YmG]|nr:hypothetical protein BV378_20405 [Nostoc sp. RF31YmG]